MLLTFYIKTFKILTCSVLILGLKLYRFGLFSKGFYCLLFNVLFVPFLVGTFCIILYLFQFVNTFFDFFQKKFQTIFEQNKKLVIIVFILFIKFIFITNSFHFFICCKVLSYNNTFIFKCQYIFYIFLNFFDVVFCRTLVLVYINIFILFCQYFFLFFLNFY